MLNLRKCKSARSSLKFLGHIIDATGICADPEKNPAIVEIQAPTGIRTRVEKISRHSKSVREVRTEPCRTHTTTERSPSQEQCVELRISPTGNIKDNNPHSVQPCSRHESICGHIIFWSWSSATAKGGK